MEVRKVQVTGGSSYIISLPKSWVKSIGLRKNDPLRVIVQPDMSLLILPPAVEYPHGEKSSKIFRAEEFSSEEFLLRCMIGAYISGYREIVVTASEEIPSHIRDMATRFSRMLIGQEIIEETPGRIVIRDILDPAEMPFDRILSRMHIIVRSMYMDSLDSIRRRDENLAREVIHRDSELDRLHWLIARYQSMVTKNPSIASKMQLKIGTCVNYFEISRIMERIGDHTVRIAHHGMEIYPSLSEALTDSLISAGEFAMEMFESSFEAYRKRDTALAQSTLERLNVLKKRCEEANSRALELESEYALSTGYIVESIRRTGEYSADICEYVIDYFM